MNLQRNIRVYYFQQIFAGLIFTLPIWVAFQRRFLSYEQMAWLQSASFLIGILLQLPTGALADSRATALSTLNMLVTLLCAVILFSLSKIQQVYLTTTVFTILGVMTLLLVVPSMFYLMKVSVSKQ